MVCQYSAVVNNTYTCTTIVFVFVFFMHLLLCGMDLETVSYVLVLLAVFTYSQ